LALELAQPDSKVDAPTWGCNVWMRPHGDATWTRRAARAAQQHRPPHTLTPPLTAQVTPAAARCVHGAHAVGAEHGAGPELVADKDAQADADEEADGDEAALVDHKRGAVHGRGDEQQHACYRIPRPHGVADGADEDARANGAHHVGNACGWGWLGVGGEWRSAAEDAAANAFTYVHEALAWVWAGQAVVKHRLKT